LPHLDDVYTLARYLLAREADAEDAVQECYLRALRYFDTFNGDAVKPWLFAILRNVCRSIHANRQGLVFGESATASDNVQPLWSEAGESPEGLLIQRHDAMSMREAVQSLPAEFREVLVLRELNDLSYREIAAVIEAPIGTVMSRLARARALLREAWAAGQAGDRR
jgi:RNA polymerase sigma-70 factor (ECF subfamily)